MMFKLGLVILGAFCATTNAEGSASASGSGSGEEGRSTTTPAPSATAVSVTPTPLIKCFEDTDCSEWETGMPDLVCFGPAGTAISEDKESAGICGTMQACEAMCQASVVGCDGTTDCCSNDDEDLVPIFFGFGFVNTLDYHHCSVPTESYDNDDDVAESVAGFVGAVVYTIIAIVAVCCLGCGLFMYFLWCQPQNPRHHQPPQQYGYNNTTTTVQQYPGIVPAGPYNAQRSAQPYPQGGFAPGAVPLQQMASASASDVPPPAYGAGGNDSIIKVTDSGI